jgi:hypothetical protein
MNKKDWKTKAKKTGHKIAKKIAKDNPDAKISLQVGKKKS